MIAEWRSVIATRKIREFPVRLRNSYKVNQERLAELLQALKQMNSGPNELPSVDLEVFCKNLGISFPRTILASSWERRLNRVLRKLTVDGRSLRVIVRGIEDGLAAESSWLFLIAEVREQ